MTSPAVLLAPFFQPSARSQFDNPKVLKAIFKTMRFWLDMGVDGFRLDAIAYLVEREGTNNENLPETHDVIKKMPRRDRRPLRRPPAACRSQSVAGRRA